MMSLVSDNLLIDASRFGPEDVESPEVKAMVFITIRGFLPGYLGEERFKWLRNSLGDDTRKVLDEADQGEWVSERHLFAILQKIYVDILDQDEQKYLQFARNLAAAGISRFLRVVLTLASERFILRRVPAMWNHLRRNAGTVVSSIDGDMVRLTYSNFSYMAERFYQLLSLANCQAVVFAATSQLPEGRIAHANADSLVLEFQLRSL